MPHRDTISHYLTDLRFAATLNIPACMCTSIEFLCISKSILEISVILIIEKKRVFSISTLEILQTDPSREHDFPLDWAGKEIFSISLNLLRGFMRIATSTILHDKM